MTSLVEHFASKQHFLAPGGVQISAAALPGGHEIISSGRASSQAHLHLRPDEIENRQLAW